MRARHDPEHLLDTAVTALATGDRYQSVLDELPAPIYVTDPTGAVIYWNRACTDFAGHEPQLGKDRWCVTWQLFTTTGEPLADHSCPMTQALKHKRPVRDVITIGERPDGSRVAFKTYPTPVLGEDGALRACVNMLVDVTEEQARALHEQADRCRRLAGATYDRTTSRVLDDMASGFDRTADELARQRSS